MGVHSILDVGSAILATFIVLIIFNKLFDKLEEKPNLDIVISVVGLIIMSSIVILSLIKSYPMDYDAAGKLIVDPAYVTLGSFYSSGLVAGFLVSWPLERRFIKFSHEGTNETKVVRFICGVIGIGLIEKVIIPIIGSSTPLQNFSGMFLIGVFVMLVYPAIIKFFQNRAESTK